MNKQALLQETYDSAFNDELEKIAKASPEQMKAFKSETKKWQGEIGSIRGKAPRKHKYAPLMGAMTGGVAGVGAGVGLAKTLLKNRPGLATAAGAVLGGIGPIVGAIGGVKAIKNTDYGKGMSKANNKYRSAVRKIEKGK